LSWMRVRRVRREMVYSRVKARVIAVYVVSTDRTGMG
jgi:hypothetical protein